MIKNAFARYAAILLVIVMAFSLFACDKSDKNDGGDVLQTEEKTTQAQTVETGEETTTAKTETTTAVVETTNEETTTTEATVTEETTEATTVTEAVNTESVEATTVTEAETTVTAEVTTVTEEETTVTEEETTVTEEETTVTEEETTVTEEKTTVTEEETTVTEEKTTVTEEETTVTEEETTVTEEETTEAETEAPKCKHRNAGVSYEKGCIIWCPDCESQVGVSVRHKNELKYVDGEGYYDVCKNCGTKTGDGAPYLVDWNAEALNEQKLGKYQNAIVGVYNEDGNYTRFEGNGSLYEGQMNVVTADEFNTAVTGQYVLIKYRTNIADYNNPDDPKKIYNGSIELYYGTEKAAAGQGEHAVFNLISDNEWHIMVIDLSGAKYAPDGDGNYVAKHFRLDLINPAGAQEEKDDLGNVTYTYPALPEGYYVDLAFIAMCDDPDAFVAYFEANEDDKALCNHATTYVNDKCEVVCAGCGKYYSERHTYDCVVETVDGTIKYVMPCLKCDTKLEYTVSFGEKEPNLFLDPAYLADAVAKGNRMGETEFFVEDGSGFVRLHANTAAGKEANFMLINSGSTQVTGQYMVIKYRTTCNYSWEIFMGDEGTAPGGDGHFYFENFLANGEWQLMFVDLSTQKGSGLEANANGEYVIGHFRWDIFNTPSTEPRYIDIAYVAFADDMSALKAINGDFAKYCNHKTLEAGFELYVDDDEATDEPMKKGICTECGAEVIVELNYKFFIDDLIGSGDANSRDAGNYNLGVNGFTAAADNTIKIKGWQGVDFGADAIAYKVYDKDGNLLSGDWTVFEGVKFSTPPAENDVTKVVVAAGVDGANARRFNDYLTIDLTEYFAQSENLTIVYAFVINNIPEGSNDKYCDFLTVTNIAPAK